ncbi:MAG: hypothetical protein V3T80_09295 [Kiloniellales bacterium]
MGRSCRIPCLCPPDGCSSGGLHARLTPRPWTRQPGRESRRTRAGAGAAGIDAIFVTGGIEAEELGVDADGRADPARLTAFCEARGETPVGALPVLRW